MNAETKVAWKSRFAEAVRLCVFLAAMPLLAWGALASYVAGILNIFGPACVPGPVVLCLLVALTAWLVWKSRRVVPVVVVAGLLALPLCAEEISGFVARGFSIFSAEERPLWLMVVLSLPIFAASVVHGLRVSWFARFGCLGLGAYIQAVHIYNSFSQTRGMAFFHGGWVS